MPSYEYIPRYNYAEYANWEGDWELIKGHPHALVSNVKKQQLISSSLLGEIDRMLESDVSFKNCEALFSLDWIISDDTVVRPDLFVASHKIEGDYLTFPPTLIIEILSPSSTLRDKNIKHQLYQEQGVKYYIIVNPENKSCSIFELVDWGYIEKPALKNFQLHDNCNLSFDIIAFVQQLNLD